MNGKSSAGRDGFNGYFYIACWDIIKHDLHEAISKVFSGFETPKELDKHNDSPNP